MSARRRLVRALAHLAAWSSCLSLLHCESPRLRAHAADEALGRHDRMIAEILAYQEGQYGTSGGGYDTFRRDLLRLHATPRDIKGLLVDDPKVNGAWKAYVDGGFATEADVTNAKTFAQTLTTSMKEWQLHEGPGKNDLEQAEYITLFLAVAASSMQQQQSQSTAQADVAPTTTSNRATPNRSRNTNGRTTTRAPTARSGTNTGSGQGSRGKSTTVTVASGPACRPGTSGPGCCASAGMAQPDGSSCVFDCNCSSNQCQAGECRPHAGGVCGPSVMGRSVACATGETCVEPGTLRPTQGNGQCADSSRIQSALQQCLAQPITRMRTIRTNPFGGYAQQYGSERDWVVNTCPPTRPWAQCFGSLADKAGFPRRLSAIRNRGVSPRGRDRLLPHTLRQRARRRIPGVYALKGRLHAISRFRDPADAMRGYESPESLGRD